MKDGDIITDWRKPKKANPRAILKWIQKQKKEIVKKKTWKINYVDTSVDVNS